MNVPSSHRHWRIVLQGDSLTDAFRKPEEKNLCFQLGAGYALLAASRLIWEFPGRRFEFVNRGVSGNTISAILQRWAVDVLDQRPEIVTLLAGVNDTLFGVGLEETAAAYREILHQTRVNLPDTKFVVFTPFLLPVGEVTAAKREDLAARCEVIRGLANEFCVPHVTLQPLFDAEAALRSAEELSYDGIHLSPAGAVLMSRIWYEAVTPLLVP